MDIEFHYYMTYLIAAKAGFGSDDASTIAHSAQLIDDNDFQVEVESDDGTTYTNYISQTMNILKARPELFRIYPIFHFIPGEPRSSTAWRRDGAMHWLNTTPNSDNANRVFDAALQSGNLHRIGVSCHGYADTWAHQNFVGYLHPFNAVSENAMSTFTPNIGHADAGHHPDWPALVWKDERLVRSAAEIDNRARFLEAASRMLEKFARVADPKISQDALDSRVQELRKDLDQAIGERDDQNRRRDNRIRRYRELATTPAYGGLDLPEYDEELWFDAAVNEEVRGLKDRKRLLGDAVFLKDRYTWKDPQTHEQSDWYRFQEAVKTHQRETWDILKERNFHGLELPKW